MVTTREDYVILNVNGNNIGNLGPSGMGGLLRNSNGDWIWSFSGHLGRQENLFAELMDLRKGFSLVWNKGYQRLICYSDSLLPINLVSFGINLHHVYVTLIQSIKDFVTSQRSVKVIHTLMERGCCY